MFEAQALTELIREVYFPWLTQPEAIQAGQLAMAASAYEEATSHFEGALKAARQDDDRTRVCELLVDLGEAQRCAGDAAHRDTLLRAGDLAYETGTRSR